ncbi:unnamed protein product [Peronospora belbahrii]|uniref:Methyltransferase domain-containing protein n=1 Tax=Peronospora belbahrii TaxID=622444 RepID=A0AAU9LAD3_9STRA|nr:unnamed protein product [Peronospora belbahrii]CAH0517062.1 unnamed protein product [Peronospora belbahrii]
MKQIVRRIQNWSLSRKEVRLHFRCTKCGKCCTGTGGRVRVNEQEIQELAVATNLPLTELKQGYTSIIQVEDANGHKKTQQVLKQTPDDRQCIFLEGSKCSVYNNRPTQCRTFPWWPQHLVSDYDWHVTANKCEGIRMFQQGDEQKDSIGYSFDDVIPEMILHDIHQSGENFTYDQLQQMLWDLQEVDPKFMEQYKAELFQKFSRRIVFSNKEVTVLDNFVDSIATRSLVFNNRMHLIQSEIAICETSNANTDAEPEFDRTTLAFDVHRALCMPLAWLLQRDANIRPLRASVLGAGACILPLFLLEHLSPQELGWLDAVEPSSQVNIIAQHFFGVKAAIQRDERLLIHEKTGEDFLVEQKDVAFDLLVLDVEAGESFAGVQAPPIAMLEPSFLYETVRVLAPHGILAINVITESKRVLDDVETKLAHVFTRGLRLSLPANTTFFLFNDKRDDSTPLAVNEFIRLVRESSFQTQHAQTSALLETCHLTAWVSKKTMRPTTA